MVGTTTQQTCRRGGMCCGVLVSAIVFLYLVGVVRKVGLWGNPLQAAPPMRFRPPRPLPRPVWKSRGVCNVIDLWCAQWYNALDNYLKGQHKMLYKNKFGGKSDIPWTREEALADGTPRYMWSEDDTFGRCGAAFVLPSGAGAFCACMARYTEMGDCVECTSRTLWREALDHPEDLPMTQEEAELLGVDYLLSSAPCREGPHLRTYRINGDGESCTTCSDAPSPRDVSKANGLATFIPKSKCKVCRTKSPRHTENGHCLKCEAVRGPVELSARQKARNAGETKYMPEKVCMACGTQSFRRVHDSACDGCKAETAAKNAKPLSARMVAIKAGETKFMPETPCPHCETRALRHVTNSRCDGCKAKKKEIKPSSRAEAKREGQVNYMPLEVCLSCGTTSLRSVKDGTCEGCTKIVEDARASMTTSTPVNEATRTAMATIPSGQAISLEVAQSCGFDAFRPTGGKWLHIETLTEISA